MIVPDQNGSGADKEGKRGSLEMDFSPSLISNQVKMEFESPKFSADLHSTVIAFMLGNLWAMDSL